MFLEECLINRVRLRLFRWDVIAFIERDTPLDNILSSSLEMFGSPALSAAAKACGPSMGANSGYISASLVTVLMSFAFLGGPNT